MARKAAKKITKKNTAPKAAKKATRKPGRPAKTPSSQLTTAMAHVKISLVEVLDIYKRKQEARISAIEDMIAGPKKGPGRKAKQIPQSCGEKLAKKLASLKVKPKKGRGKDLVKIEKLLEGLMEHIPKDS